MSFFKKIGKQTKSFFTKAQRGVNTLASKAELGLGEAQRVARVGSTILDNPITMESITIRQLGITTIKVSPWIKFSDDSMFVMDMEKIITMTEVTDEDLIKIHQKFVRERNKKSNKSELTSKMGYLSSIADARISLEKLYKSN